MISMPFISDFSEVDGFKRFKHEGAVQTAAPLPPLFSPIHFTPPLWIGDREN